MATEQQARIEDAVPGITMNVEFVPFSQSRNRGDKSPSLNWKVSLCLRGRTLLTVDYSAGWGHCPARKNIRNPLSVDEWNSVKQECETGRQNHNGLHGKPILPQLADVMRSLVSKADVINYATFEEWASALGYDADSRKAEATYRACLETGLKLRNALGKSGLQALRTTLQDY